jgi:ABC-type transport system involved in multi-copper enzyme maturation permease subunit
VTLLVPGYVAGAVALEKEARTLEALLGTDLLNREIILSKLLVRLGNLTLMLITGLPILSLLQFAGGIDPDLVLAGFAGTLVTLASLVSLSILNSVYAKRARDAILYTYLEMAAYVALTGLSAYLPVAIAVPGFSLGPVYVSIGSVLAIFTAGNPVLALGRLTTPLALGGRLGDVLPDVLAEYALFHGLAAVLFAAWASLALRAVYLKQAHGETRKTSRGLRRWRPRVGNRPMLWKEVVADPGWRLNWFGRTALLCLVAASFIPPLYFETLRGTIRSEQLGQAFGDWARVLGTILACLLLVVVAVRAATAVSGERERQTLESLLTSPLDSTAILSAKWLGTVLSVRWGWLWLGAVWTWGLAEAALHPLALPLAAAVWLVYASLLATIGLWCSIVCRTSMQALVTTLFLASVLGAGLLVLPANYLPSAGLSNYPAHSWAEWVTRFQAGLIPPMVLGRLLPFWKTDAISGSWEREFAYLGVACWAALSVAAWAMTCRQFRRVTGRQAVRRPEREEFVSEGRSRFVGQTTSV